MSPLIAVLALLTMQLTTVSTAAETDANVVLRRRDETMRRKPDVDAPNVRVWTIRRTEGSRTNLVEMIGELGFHVHPDADHTLTVLEGQVCAWYGNGKVVALGPGDYLSIPKGIPHKYKTITPKALLMSFDAPPYDPAKTQPVSEEGVKFELCPSLEGR